MLLLYDLWHLERTKNGVACLSIMCPFQNYIKFLYKMWKITIHSLHEKVSMYNSNTKRKILQKLTESDSYKFIYDKKDINYGNKILTDSFYATIAQEVNADQLEQITSEDVQKETKFLRDKFVRLNKKLKRGENICAESKEFYKKFVFLEDFISHRDEEVYKTLSEEKPDYASLINILDVDDYLALRPSKSPTDVSIEEFPDCSSIFTLGLDTNEKIKEDVVNHDIKKLFVLNKENDNKKIKSETHNKEMKVMKACEVKYQDLYTFQEETSELEILDEYADEVQKFILANYWEKNNKLYGTVNIPLKAKGLRETSTENPMSKLTTSNSMEEIDKNVPFKVIKNNTETSVSKFKNTNKSNKKNNCSSDRESLSSNQNKLIADHKVDIDFNLLFEGNTKKELNELPLQQSLNFEDTFFRERRSNLLEEIASILNDSIILYKNKKLRALLLSRILKQIIIFINSLKESA